MINNSDFENSKDIIDAIKKIKALQKQQQVPDRNGMISALQDAKSTALFEITNLELLQGDANWRPFSNFTDRELYLKLTQYQQGLENYCIAKIGKKAFDKLLGCTEN